jgi:hypothetical protein
LMPSTARFEAEVEPAPFSGRGLFFVIPPQSGHDLSEAARENAFGTA